MDEKALKDAWKSFTKKLECEGESIPSEDAGSTYYDPSIQARRRIPIMDSVDIEALIFEGVAFNDSKKQLTNEEWVQKIREICGDSLTSIEKAVICDRFVFGDTFEQIAQNRQFSGGRKGVSGIFNRGLKKLRRKLERTVRNLK